MDRLKRICRWIKRYWKQLIAACGILMLLILGIAYKRNSIKNKIQQQKIKILEAAKEVMRLEGQREIIRREEDKVEDRIDDIDSRIDALNSKIKVARNEVDRLSLKEKLREFQNLGY